jgi:hypothetical protein
VTVEHHQAQQPENDPKKILPKQVLAGQAAEGFCEDLIHIYDGGRRTGQYYQTLNLITIEKH